MLIRINPRSTVPLHEQLAGQLRAALAAGDPAPGERLPPAREIARSLGINVHTALRAYQALQREGLLDVRRGRGTVVTGTASSRAGVVARAHELVREARRAGMPNDEILRLVEGQL